MATAVQYGIMAGVIVVVVVGAAALLGEGIRKGFEEPPAAQATVNAVEESRFQKGEIARGGIQEDGTNVTICVGTVKIVSMDTHVRNGIYTVVTGCGPYGQPIVP